ncbi:YpdA family putative bacillithiol disulfide reductase [Brevibacillus composti]|uniref:YpdA family putative bacillithiol disulfide reductase n=1 Tax=Brevibacillus composti TaxID=2796470 RepID=A0A7T5EHE2_9BACL|nr:YpdA family putative bacillithiol disulfide reductase [Brevibacillus composti]QQE72605.1 YpdA family putative bacillithiol disulfide reductase [Brevibacillus composti]QUO39682.1 YpdA family putative bacillithiol disulfide reductase [Brevibacillus composti]
MEQVLIIGAGPCGLAAAVELKRRGIDPLVIEKGTLVHSIYRYPTYMIFHSTPERLEIGDIPFSTPNEKPTRAEALNYYRLVAARHQLRIHLYEEVFHVEREAEGFLVRTRDRFQAEQTYRCRYLVLATGYFDNPNRLHVPGENLKKVSAFFTEAHPYAGMKVAVIGGNNSAVDAAMELERAGAEVTVLCRKPTLSDRVKAWTRPVFESLAEKGRIQVLYAAEVQEIRERELVVRVGGEVRTLANDFVFSLIGFRPDRAMLAALGAQTDPHSGEPVHDPDTMETNVPGLYIAGVIASGEHANAIFIENGRDHGKLIAEHIAQSMGSAE